MDIEECKRIGVDEKGRKMIWVRLRNKEQRKEILSKRRNLKGKKGLRGLEGKENMIEMMEEIARKEKRYGKKIWKRIWEG